MFLALTALICSIYKARFSCFPLFFPFTDSKRPFTKHGVTDFVVGHYGRFDSMAARAVHEEKARYPEVTLTLLLPYYPYTYDTDKYDGSFYPPGMEAVPKPYAIVRANQYMLRHSEYLICYCRGYPGNTRSLVETALRRQAAGLLSVAFIEE